MKILYKQDQPNLFGISNAYLKQILIERDAKSITKKVHHHTDFEIHIIEKGLQAYEIGERIFQLRGGDYLIIPPHIKHRMADSSPDTLKYSITFHADAKQTIFPFSQIADPLSGCAPEQLQENLGFIGMEHKRNRESSHLLIENRLLETIVLFFRAAGILEQPGSSTDTTLDSRITLAKQYIDDNVEQNLSASDIAKYCYLSPKQLARLFVKYEGVSLSDYIKKKRIEHTADLLLDDSLSLKQISERMHFNNEYYFNTFVKRHLGQPPGAYRKMHRS